MKRSLTLLFVVLLIAGCAGKRHYSSNLMAYLYPDSRPEVAPSLPVLDLPLTVGIAFVPNQETRSSLNFWSWNRTLPKTVPISEKEKTELLSGVADEFRDRDFIERLEVIPSSYLTAYGGFDNLEQIRSLYGLDVIALVSYDQVQNIDENYMSLSYWTIIGAYMVRGEKNSTNTLIDAAVFHIPSKNLLFRAPGTSFIKGQATPVNLDEQLRRDSAEGFRLASGELIGNLQVQLEAFQEKVREQPDKYQVSYRPGSSYGGHIGPWGMVALFVIGLAAVARQKEKKQR